MARKSLNSDDTRRNVFGFLFALKAVIAFAGSCGLFYYFGLEIWRMRKTARSQPAPFKFTPGAPECAAERNALGRLVPPSNKLMLGFHLDWQGNNLPLGVVDTLAGRNPAIFNDFFTFDYRSTPKWDINNMNWHADQISRVGRGTIYEMTMSPVMEMGEIPISALEEIANECQRINMDFGLPILLRYGHEMNGKNQTGVH